MVDSRYVRLATDVREAIAEVQDFPKAGIGFKDLTTVLLRPELYKGIVSWMVDRARDYERQYGKIDKVVAVESRGYWFGCPLAVELDAGFVPIRKPGKLPRPTTSIESKKEYGGDVLHIHTGDILPGDKTILVDDLLATGGTVEAACDLAKKFLEEQRGGRLLAVFTPVELGVLGGRSRIRYPLESLVVYE